MTRVKPAIALISSPAFLAALVAALFCRVRRIPYVLDIRDVYPQVYCEAGLLQKASVAYRLLMALSRQMYSAASRVVVVTKGLGGVVGRVAPRARATCIYNGYPGGVARYRAAKHDRYTVCFHGVMGFFQDIETLRELAFALLPHDIDVVVIGYGRKEGMLRHDVPANLRFLGRLPFGETMRQVSMCHVGLCLRLDDGISRDAFPIKVWEYLGLGMPCLVTPPCEAGAFLEEHDCGRQLGTGDVEGLRRAILELRAAPGPIDKQGWSGVSAVQGYTRERMAEAVAAVVMESLPVTPR